MLFYVNKHTLIPRFCTETLVEVAIRNAKPNGHILDLCTGSGSIACVLAFHDFKVTASDISRKALKVARKNARLYDLDIDFVCGDLLDAPGLAGKKFDAIVSNPPYIRTEDIGKHDESILYEPRIAFDGGAEGYDFYHRIARRAGDFLKPGGTLFLETCDRTASGVKSLLELDGFKDVTIVRDVRGLDRVLMAKK